MVCTVPGAPAMLNLMMSRPPSPAGASPEAAFVLAAVMASRRVTNPSKAMLSSTLVTVIVAGTARISSGSRPKRVRQVGGTCRERIGVLDSAETRRYKLASIKNLLCGARLERILGGYDLGRGQRVACRA